MSLSDSHGMPKVLAVAGTVDVRISPLVYCVHSVIAVIEHCDPIDLLDEVHQLKHARRRILRLHICLDLLKVAGVCHRYLLRKQVEVIEMRVLCEQAVQTERHLVIIRDVDLLVLRIGQPVHFQEVLDFLFCLGQRDPCVMQVSFTMVTPVSDAYRYPVLVIHVIRPFLSLSVFYQRIWYLFPAFGK